MHYVIEKQSFRCAACHLDYTSKAVEVTHVNQIY